MRYVQAATEHVGAVFVIITHMSDLNWIAYFILFVFILRSRNNSSVGEENNLLTKVS